MGRLREALPSSEAKVLIENLRHLPTRIQEVLEKTDGEIQRLAKVYAHKNNFLYLGRGVGYPIALEGALKLKEISYIHAEGYPAAEMKHGPIALIDENMPTIVLAFKGRRYEKVIGNVMEVKARKGIVIAIATEGNKDIASKVDEVIYIPHASEFISPILAVIPLQLLAYYIAVEKKCSVDQPRNLAKSVTVE
jgi:glucosamine--fructose-6-phosphate aminotransferase (isomerizing)